MKYQQVCDNCIKNTDYNESYEMIDLPFCEINDTGCNGRAKYIIVD